MAVITPADEIIEKPRMQRSAVVPVSAKTVDHVQLYSWLPTYRRLDVWPFAILYVLWICLALPKLSQLDASLILLGLAVIHILVILFTVWSVEFRCYAHGLRVNNVDAATLCKVVPAKFNGSKEVVPLTRQKRAEDNVEVRFDFRKQRFIYSEEEGQFVKLGFPSKETFGTYFRATGYGTEAKAAAALQKWGKNLFEFPKPTFVKLYQEQLLEPFFVFQVFCVGLWCLDDYWYYSLFTLFMLLLFESTVVKARLKTLTELRQVRVDGQQLWTHRGGKWSKLSGMDLLPGDVVSIGRPTGLGSEERTVPGDLLLLAGTAIANEALLTGESTPQWKMPILGRDVNERLSVRRDKPHVLFGGTKILQHTGDKNAYLKTPDGGCLAMVLRTGFDTSQGKLMRTILFSTERVTANNWESGLFICFLVIFALIAAGYVLVKGLENPNASRYKLFLNCTLIITSVIPPELPMELSIAVNTSLIALARKGIFCTEPFRIPFAGKVDICCFDKTGTLTTDDMEFRGVADLAEDEDELKTGKGGGKLPEKAVHVLATCHALVLIDNKMVGDPLEKAALKGVEWVFTGDDRAFARNGKGKTIQVVTRYHFSSHLKRMAVIARMDDTPGFMVLAKGAPETIEERLAEVPPRYSEVYKRYTRQGARVLALAYKLLPDMPVSNVREMEREGAESDLVFAGFAVFACPVRADSGDVLSELSASSHELMMITGDQALTACHVAAAVNLLARPVLILTLRTREPRLGGFDWVSPDEAVCLPYSEDEVEDVAAVYDLCVAGDGLNMLQRTQALSLVVPRTQVFARVAPEQKELILLTLRESGRVTLMCGDGTNDVGALKQASIGVALLNAIPPAKKPKPEEAADGGKEGAKKVAKDGSIVPAEKKGPRVRKPRPLPPPTSLNANGAAAAAGSTSGTKTALLAAAARAEGEERGPRALSARDRAIAEQKEKLAKMMKEMEDEGDSRSAPTVKLGDASMAAPFTAKHASVCPTVDIIRQGRSTLVTTLQMFKILGLNCLATAYVLSVMYLDGVKLGDVQATISGVFTASFFLFISHAKPLPTLSAQRPHPSVFSYYVFLSVLGQFAIHLVFLYSVVEGARAYMPAECIEPESTFHPNLVNTVSYMSNMMIQVATFAVNYVGHPFNESVRENRFFSYALTSAFVFFTVLTSDQLRLLNEKLQLVPLPQPYGLCVLAGSFVMMGAAWGWERLLRWVFPAPLHKDLLRRQKQRAEAAVDQRLKLE